MAQQWRDVLATQIIEHMYENEDEDWFVNRLVQMKCEHGDSKTKTSNPWWF
jgi:hypothetical protein